MNSLKVTLLAATALVAAAGAVRADSLSNLKVDFTDLSPVIAQRAAVTAIPSGFDAAFDSQDNVHGIVITR